MQAQLITRRRRVSASGGSISNVGDYTIHTFNSTGTLTIANGGIVDILIVGAGGGGGGKYANSNGSSTAGADGVVIIRYLS